MRYDAFPCLKYLMRPDNSLVNRALFRDASRISDEEKCENSKKGTRATNFHQNLCVQRMEKSMISYF